MEDCPYCGMAYGDFRTGLTFKNVRDLFWVGNDDPSQWRYKRRHTVLGKWHQIKQEMWAEHIECCEADYEVNE